MCVLFNALAWPIGMTFTFFQSIFTGKKNLKHFCSAYITCVKIMHWRKCSLCQADDLNLIDLTAYLEHLISLLPWSTRDTC